MVLETPETDIPKLPGSPVLYEDPEEKIGT